MSHAPDVMIVGAGPVGLLTAIELTLGGLSVLVLERLASPSKAMKAMAITLSSPSLYRTGGKVGRWVFKHAPFAVNNQQNPWYKHREMPKAPEQSFGEWYNNRKEEKKS